MTRMWDLPGDLVEEIFSRVPLTSLNAVRSTCKEWNALSKNHILGKKTDAAARKQLLGFMVMDSKLCLMNFDLLRIHKHRDLVDPSTKKVSRPKQTKFISKSFDWDSDLVDPSIKQISILNKVEICQVFHWDGLLFCVIKNKRWRLVWNPYLGQMRWIKPINKFHPADMYAFGYQDNNNNRNHKILRFLDVSESSSLLPFFEIYDFNSNSWRVLDVNPGCDIKGGGVSLKGNTYFLVREKLTDQVSLLCFDFTTERFGPRLTLPLHFRLSCLKAVTLSCVSEEKLAVLYQPNDHIVQVWITKYIDPNAAFWSVLWSKEMEPCGFVAGSFFVDEEKDISIVSEFRTKFPTDSWRRQVAYILGEHGCKSVNIGGTRKPGDGYYNQLMFSSYAPSLVQLKINHPVKRKERL